jgi:hypothetical protein
LVLAQHKKKQALKIINTLSRTFGLLDANQKLFKFKPK